MTDHILQYITHTISGADPKAAAERVAALRESHPDAPPAELVELLIRRKCRDTGAIGAITSGASLVPGLGTVISLTFGVAADASMTFRLQAELVLEIAAVYERAMDEAEKRNTILLVTGISAGANQMLERGGTKIATEVTDRLAQRSVAKAIPVFGVAASAGVNILSTYVIGQRANAYFSLGPEAVGDWADSLRAVTGVDERKLVEWLTDTTEDSWTLVKGRVQDAAGSVIVTGKSAGELLVVSADRAKQIAASARRSRTGGRSAVAGAVVSLGKRASANIATGAEKAGKVMSSAGQSVATATSAAASKLVVTGKAVREGASATRHRLSKALGRFRRAKGNDTG